MPGTPTAETAAAASLYDVLAEPAPWPVTAGETGITATKETIDNDAEDVSDDDILQT